MILLNNEKRFVKLKEVQTSPQADTIKNPHLILPNAPKRTDMAIIDVLKVWRTKQRFGLEMETKVDSKRDEELRLGTQLVSKPITTSIIFIKGGQLLDILRQGHILINSKSSNFIKFNWTCIYWDKAHLRQSLLHKQSCNGHKVWTNSI